MTLFEEMALDVAELLEELGQPVLYTRYTHHNDLVEGTSIEVPILRQELRTAIIPASGSGNVEQLDVAFMADVADGKERTLAICSTEGAIFRPESKDRAYFKGQEWIIRGCTPINVDGATDVVFLLSFTLP